MQTATELNVTPINQMHLIEGSKGQANERLKCVGTKIMNVIIFVLDSIFSRSPVQEQLDQMRLKYQQLRPL